MRLLFFLALFCGLIGTARAADLTVRVLDKGGKPVADAVVTFTPDERTVGPIKFPWPYRVAQKDIQFSPRLLIVPVGATVSFPNLDKIRHHVYSFSAGNRFELQLYGQDETRTHTFTTAGVAAIGCNIHDQMSAYIVIVDTPFAAATGAEGIAHLAHAAGAGEVRVWHRLSRAKDGFTVKALTLPAGGDHTETLTLDLRPDAHMTMN